MPDELAFLTAIRDQPRSRDLRMVYADWLTDRGDPRGDFIRVQCRAATAPRDSVARADLEAEADALRFRHEEEWLAPFLPHAGNWGWERGLLDFVTVETTAFLDHAELWLPAQPLLGVHLRRAGPHLAKLAQCPALRHVTGLYLGDNDLTDEQLAPLLTSPHLGRLRALVLHFNKLGPETCKLLATTRTLPRLSHLNLSGNTLEDAGVVALAGAHLPQLRVLHLSMARYDNAGFQALIRAPLVGQLRYFETLLLSPDGGLVPLFENPGFASIITLDLNMSLAGDRDITALANAPTAANLRDLYLPHFSALTDAALHALATSPYLGNLRRLHIGTGQFTRPALDAVLRSRCLPRLSDLAISPNEQRLPNLHLLQCRRARVRNLHSLHIDPARLKARALAALAAHPRPLRLRKFDVRVTGSRLSAWRDLVGRGHLDRIGTLHLHGVCAGGLRPLLEPGRLPALHDLMLGLPDDLAEFQEFLASALFRRLRTFRLWISHDHGNKDIPAVLRMLLAAWDTPRLRSLALDWSLTPEHVALLTACRPPAGLTKLEIGSMRMGVAGAAAVAAWPGLRQLHKLRFHHSSHGTIEGLEALATAPHVGPLLRIDVQNASIAKEAHQPLRERFGLRVAIGYRRLPRTMVMGVGDWGTDRLD